MRVDEQLARDAQPVVRLFAWSAPALSLGYRQLLPAEIAADRCAASGVAIVERPTGGGIAFHGSDLSCSVTVPETIGMSIHEVMEGVAESVVMTLAEFGIRGRWMAQGASTSRLAYCLTEPASYSIMVGPRKLCGFALRRYPESWLIQGSWLVHPILPVMSEALPSAVIERVRARSVSMEEASSAVVDEGSIQEAFFASWQRVWMDEEVLSHAL